MDVRVGGPLRYERLAVFPLFLSASDAVAYRLGSEAIRTGTLAIERNPAGSSIQLTVENRDDARVLLLAGESLPGNSASTACNRSVLLPARSKIEILAKYLEPTRERTVAGKHGGMGLSGANLAEFKRRLAYVDQASGFVTAIARQIVAVELLDLPPVCQSIWDRMIGELASAARATPCPGWARILDVQRLLLALSRAPWQRMETAGEGDLHRAELPDAARASSLSLDGHLIQLSCLLTRMF